MTAEPEATSDENVRLKATMVRFPPEVHAALKERAERDDRTMAALVRRAVKRYLADAPPTPPPAPERETR